MSRGKSVHIEGLGYFRYTLETEGVADEARFDFETQKKAVRVQFIPEREKSASGAITRGMVDYDKLEWIELGAAEESGSSETATPAVTALNLGGTALGSGTTARSLTAGSNLADVSAVKVALNGTDYDVTVSEKSAIAITGTITLSAAVTANSAEVKLDGTSKFIWTAASGGGSEQDQDPMG